MKRLSILLFAIVAMVCNAQAQLGDFYNPLGSNIKSDTLTLASATGTIYLTSHSVAAAPATSTTVRVKIYEISGTTAGVLTLMGSFEPNANFKALNTPNTVTALPTITALDQTSATTTVYDWDISASPYPYYRISWTVTTGTLSSILSGQFFRAK
jgi:hypothetical protein